MELFMGYDWDGVHLIVCTSILSLDLDFVDGMQSTHAGHLDGIKATVTSRLFPRGHVTTLLGDTSAGVVKI